MIQRGDLPAVMAQDGFQSELEWFDLTRLQRMSLAVSQWRGRGRKYHAKAPARGQDLDGLNT